MVSGGCCTPSGNFPLPNDRESAGSGFLANNPRRRGGPNDDGGGRRPTYFSRRVHRASAIVQNPRSVTLREFAVIAFAAFALYRAFLLANGPLRDLLFVTPVGSLCRFRSAFSCTGFMLRQVFNLIMYQWAAGVIPWGFVAAVVVFFGEEALAAIRGRK